MSSRFWWGTVVQEAPLRVRRDGQGGPADGTPSTLVAGLVVGDRVRCEQDGRHVIIHGKSEG